MAMNFPASPTLNQIYTDPVSSAMYKWNGFAWASTVSVTPSDSYTKAESDAIKAATDAANTTNFVNVPGDTMTGALTLPTLVFSYGGSISSDGNIVFTGGAAGGLYPRFNSYNFQSLNGAATYGTLSAAGLNITGAINATGAVNGTLHGFNGMPGYFNADATWIYQSGGSGFYATGQIYAASTITSATQITSNGNINAAGTVTGVHGSFVGGTVTANQLVANTGTINGTLNANQLGAYAHLQCNGTLAVGGVTTMSTLNCGVLNVNGGPCYIDHPNPQIRYTGDNVGAGLYNTSAGYAVGMYLAAGICRFGNFYGNGGPAGNWFQVAADSCQLFGAGGAWKPGGGSWADSSDARIKNVLGNYENGLASLLTLNPVRYTFKGNDTAANTAPSAYAALPPPDEAEPRQLLVPYANSPHHQAAETHKEFIGLIAQDAEVAFPEIVMQRAGMIDGVAVIDLRALDPSALTYALINAVKELSAINDALAVRIAALEARPA